MTNRARILTCGNCHGFDRLAAQLAELGIELLGWSEVDQLGAAAAPANEADAIVYACGPSSSLRDDLSTIRAATEAPVVVLIAEGSGAVLEDALAVDVADVLLLPQPPETVLFAIMKASRGPRRNGSDRRAKVITVMSPKGGTGKTVIATNLAATFTSQMGARTLLLDLDLQFGDTAIMLGIEPEKTLYDLVVGPGELDAEKLSAFITRHESGLEVIAAPLRPEDAELVSEHRLARLLDVARTIYDVIVVDTSPYFHAPMLATLDRTDEILLLCAAFDVPTLKNVRLSLQTLALLSFPAEKINLVLNRFSPKIDISREEVESALEARTTYELPNDRAVPRCVNLGEPVVVAEPSATFSRAMRDLAGELAPVLAAEAPLPLPERDLLELTSAPKPPVAGWRRFLSFPSSRRSERVAPEQPKAEAGPMAEAETEPDLLESEPMAEVPHSEPASLDAGTKLEPPEANGDSTGVSPADVVVDLERQLEARAAAGAATAFEEPEVNVAFRELIDHLRHLGELANQLGRAVGQEPDGGVGDVRPAAWK